MKQDGYNNVIVNMRTMLFYVIIIIVITITLISSIGLITRVGDLQRNTSPTLSLSMYTVLALAWLIGYYNYTTVVVTLFMLLINSHATSIKTTTIIMNYNDIVLILTHTKLCIPLPATNNLRYGIHNVIWWIVRKISCQMSMLYDL